MTTIKTTGLFVGYSTNNTNSKHSRWTDIDLVNRDLYCHFMTRRGERIMMPNWGFAGWDLLFEPFDEYVKDQIIESSEQIIAADSRVKLLNIVVTEYEYGIQLQMDLLYVPFDAVNSFSIDFDKRSITS